MVPEILKRSWALVRLGGMRGISAAALSGAMCFSGIAWGQTAPPAQAQGQGQTQAAADDNDLINPDRPGIADGSTVVGKKKFQIEVGVQSEHRSHDNDKRLFVPALLRFGLDSQWELRIETAGAYSWQDIFGVKSSGYSPTSVGVKFHWQDSKGISHPSMGAILRVFPSSGSGAFASTATTGDLRLAVDWDVAPKWEINPNVGIGLYQDENNNTFTTGLAAMTINYNPTPILNYFIDGGFQALEQRNGKAALILDAGIAYIMGKNIQLDFSIGTGVTGETTPHPFIAAGISYRL